MSKKYTSKDYKRVLTEVLTNGFYHIQAINNEIQAMKITDPATASQDDQNKLRALTMTLTLVNDLIHPAHPISYACTKVNPELIDYCVNIQKKALEHKLVDKCFCSICSQSNNYPSKNVSEDTKPVTADPAMGEA